MNPQLWTLLLLVNFFCFGICNDENNSSTQFPKSENSTDANFRSKREQESKAYAEARRARNLERAQTFAKNTIQAAAGEACDWKKQPLAALKGEVCGSKYKVLGLDRKKVNWENGDLRKAYRQKSLSVHPDKNKSSEATEAFGIVRNAYECLNDEACKTRYDEELAMAEEEIFKRRQQLKEMIIDKAMGTLMQTHYFLSIAASRVYQLGLDVWDFVGEWQVEILGEMRPLGRFALIAGLLFKGRFLLVIQGLAFGITKLNYELAKNSGLL